MRDETDLSLWTHRHHFTGGGEATAEKRARLVTGLTLATMVLEIIVGMATNSMALLADGFHMATHAAALGVAAFAYWYARRHADDPRYTFGVGKVGALGGFTSALILAMVAVGIAWESAARFLAVQEINFDEALAVAAFGLAVNIGCAVILGGGHGHGSDHEHSHGSDHDHEHGHDHDRHKHDINLRGAYLHVLADALTSVLAILALLLGKYWGWWRLDPAIGLVGAAVIVVWAWGLAQSAAAVLLDRNDDADLAEDVRAAIERDGDARIVDLHLWRVGPGHWAAIISLVSAEPATPAYYRERLDRIGKLSHVSVEVNALLRP
jgi:cation diffusion facilitator family transporter